MKNPKAFKYHQVTLTILNSLFDYPNPDLPLEKRIIVVKFVDPLNRVWKGITNAKSELVKDQRYKLYGNYKLLALRDYSKGEITFSVVFYIRDPRNVNY